MKNSYGVLVSAFALLFLVSACATTHTTKRATTKTDHVSATQGDHHQSQPSMLQQNQRLVDPSPEVLNSSVCDNRTTFQEEPKGKSYIACGEAAERIRSLRRKTPGVKLYVSGLRITKPMPLRSPHLTGGASNSVTVVESTKWYESGWFWVPVGAVVAGGIAAGLVCGLTDACHSRSSSGAGASSNVSFPKGAVINFPSGP